MSLRSLTCRRSKRVEELQAARELHTTAERKLAEGTAALDGRFEEVDMAVQVSKRTSSPGRRLDRVCDGTGSVRPLYSVLAANA